MMAVGPHQERRLPSFGAFGRTIETAARSEFFAFFHLVLAATPPDEALLVFRTTSAAFSPLVRVAFEMDGDAIAAVELHVDRAFIADPEQYPFAADITASFVRALLQGQADAEAEEIADALQRYEPAGATARVLRRVADHDPPPRTRPSIPKLVYAGEAPGYRRRFGDLDLAFSNTPSDDAARFSLRAQPSAAPPQPGPIPGLEPVEDGDPLHQARLRTLMRRFGSDPVTRLQFYHDPVWVLRHFGIDPAILGEVSGEAYPRPDFLKPPEPPAEAG